jgi:hypothetical protein
MFTIYMNLDLICFSFSALFQARQNIFFSYVHTMFGSFLPPSLSSSLIPLPAPSFSPPKPLLAGRNYFALISNFVEERV